MPDDFMTLHDIACKFKRSPECVRLWVTRGIIVDGARCKLSGIKVGGAWLVSEADLLDWIQVPLRQRGVEA